VVRKKNITHEVAWTKRNNSDRQLFQSLRFLCQKFDEAVGINTDTVSPTHAELNDFYTSEEIQALLPPNLTPKGRKRRKHELAWKTVADALKKRVRLENQQQNPPL